MGETTRRSTVPPHPFSRGIGHERTIPMSKTIAIYIRRNTVNGKEYVGQSVDPPRRFRVEFYEKTALGHALRKYGADSFENSILFWVDSQEAANFWECYLIELYGTLRPNGYNIQDGGSYGHSLVGRSADEKAVIGLKISKAKQVIDRAEVCDRYLKKERVSEIAVSLGITFQSVYGIVKDAGIFVARTQCGENNGMYGKTHSVETRKQIAEKRGDMSGEKNPSHDDNRKRRAGVVQLKLF